MPISGGGFAKATIVELCLRSRMLAAFAGSGPGTAAVATQLGLPISWTCDLAASRRSSALLYLVIILIFQMFKILLTYPPPNISLLVWCSTVASSAYSLETIPHGGGGGEGLRRKLAHTQNRVSRSSFTLVGPGGSKMPWKVFKGPSRTMNKSELCLSLACP